MFDQPEREPFGSSMEALNLRRKPSSSFSVKEKVVQKKNVKANEIENWCLNLVAIKEGLRDREREEDLLRESESESESESDE